MHSNKLLLGLVLMTLLFSGCSACPWRVGVWRETPTNVGPQDTCSSCGEVSCAGNCTGHLLSTWYPAKHLIRGFHHACGLFTCYGCGGNCWCGEACNAYGVNGWNSLPGEVTMEQQLEPIPVPNQQPNATSAKPASPPAN